MWMWKLISTVSLLCYNSQENRYSKRKIEWPSTDELVEMLKNSNFVRVGLELGVSDNAIRKYLVRQGLNPKYL